MSYNKRTSIRATRGEEMTFDELHGSKLKALINMAIALVISFSLVIAFTPLASVSSAFADPTEDPETPEMCIRDRAWVAPVPSTQMMPSTPR